MAPHQFCAELCDFRGFWHESRRRICSLPKLSMQFREATHVEGNRSKWFCNPLQRETTKQSSGSVNGSRKLCWLMTSNYLQTKITGNEFKWEATLLSIRELRLKYEHVDSCVTWVWRLIFVYPHAVADRDNATQRSVEVSWSIFQNTAVTREEVAVLANICY